MHHLSSLAQQPLHRQLGLTDGELDLLVRAGCNRFSVGAESGSPRVLGYLGKDLAPADIVAANRRMRRFPIVVYYSFVSGFPGETVDDFNETRAVMSRTGYDSAFLFKYSPRPGARSAAWEDDVLEEEKARRITLLIADQKLISLERNEALIGQDQEILVEGPAKRNPDNWFGKTRQFKTAVFRRRGESVGDLATFRVETVSPYTLFGEGVSRTAQVEEDATH